MNILVTNDDGLYAKGLNTLVDALKQKGHNVTVVAPDRNCSGVGHSLTLRRPLIVNWVNKTVVAVQGTPADCVYLAINGLLKERPDIVISGINAGENMGDDLFYSGTIGAAVEAYLGGVNALAVSLSGSYNFITAAAVVCTLLDSLDLSKKQLLNVNIPDMIKDDLKGVLNTKLGLRDTENRPKVFSEKKSGELHYWVGPPATPQEYCLNSVDYDFGAVAAGYVSITPLQPDLTDYSSDPVLCNLESLNA